MPVLLLYRLESLGFGPVSKFLLLLCSYGPTSLLDGQNLPPSQFSTLSLQSKYGNGYRKYRLMWDCWIFKEIIKSDLFDKKMGEDVYTSSQRPGLIEGLSGFTTTNSHHPHLLPLLFFRKKTLGNTVFSGTYHLWSKVCSSQE